MRTFCLRLALAAASFVMPSLAWAQHETHQAGAAQTLSADMAQCVRVQPAIENIITAATARLEAARLSNSPAEMRAAVDHLEAVLRDIHSQLAPCATAAASTDPHAGHTTPTTQPSASTAPAQAPTRAVDPHAGHVMPTVASPSKGSTPAKPAASKPENAKAADPPAAHSSEPQRDKQRDPVNGLMVDPATAPNTTYQGQTYYFSSEQSKNEFLENPAKFATKPKG